MLERADGLLVLDNPVVTSNAAQVVEAARTHRLPTIASAPRFATVGGLLAYGANNLDMTRRAADYVDKILKGARPADLPVEGPALFDFVVNLKTARTPGLNIPREILQQATDVVQQAGSHPLYALLDRPVPPLDRRLTGHQSFVTIPGRHRGVTTCHVQTARQYSSSNARTTLSDTSRHRCQGTVVLLSTDRSRDEGPRFNRRNGRSTAAYSTQTTATMNAS